MQIKKRLFGWSRIGVGRKVPSTKVGRAIFLSTCALIIAVSSILPNVPNADAALPGTQWERVSPASATKHWLGVASSDDGTKLAATAGGDYVYTSTNSGISWTQRTPAGAGVIKTWRAVASSADGTKLVVTADTDNVYTSTDSGATWTARQPAGAGNNKYWISASSSADGSVLMLGAGADSVYISTDSGATWTQRNPAGTQVRSWTSTAMSDDGSKMYAGNNAGYIYVSSDGGATWTQVDPAGVARFWAGIDVSSDGEKVVAVASNDHVYTSEDSGATWTQNIVSGASQNWLSATSSSDGTKLAVGAGSGFVYTSTDGGATWTQRDPTSTGGANMSWNSLASSADGSKLATTAAFYYVYTSTDSGATWTQRDPAGGARYWTSMASSADGMRLVAGAQSDYVYTSTDGGTTWTQRRPIGSNTNSWSACAMSDDGMRILVANNYGGAYTSIDGGETWTERFAIDVGNPNWVGAASSADGMKLVLAPTGSGYIHVSSDGGATWTAQPSAGGRLWRQPAMSADGNKIVVAPAGGPIYASTDGGTTWAPLPSGTRDWYGLAMSADGNRITAGVNGGGNNYLYTSTDGGATWTQGNILGGWRSVAMSDDGMRIVAGSIVNEYSTNGYVYTSTDGGATWTQRDPAGGSRNWRSVVSSSSGHRLAAAAGSPDDYIYVSGGSFLPTVDPSEISVSGGTVNLVGECAATNNYSFASVISHENTVHAVSYDGVVYSWGSNTYGTFGNGTTTDSNVPVSVDMNGVLTGKTITKVVATNNSISALASDGTVYSWGENTYGQLGDGTNNASSLPVAVSGALSGKTVLQLVGAGDSVYALTSDGKVYAWGSNTDGQLGNNSTINSNVPVAVDTSGVLADKAVTQIAADGHTAYALAADGKVYSWGLNDKGQLGNGGTIISSTWTQRDPYGTNTPKYYMGATTSADGQIMAVVAQYTGDPVRISTDGGVTWKSGSGGLSSSVYYDIKMSADGQTMIVSNGTSNGYIYTSTDNGQTWTPSISAGARAWRSVDVTPDGTKMAAVVSGGYIYTSTDSGQTWTQRDPAGGTRNWYGVTMSDDGSKIVATVLGGLVYSSIDGGENWVSNSLRPDNGGNAQWHRVDSSADGTKAITASADGSAEGWVYTTANSGTSSPANWTKRDPPGLNSPYNWFGVASSADGTKLLAGAAGGSGVGGDLYASADSGVTWTKQTSAGAGWWRSLAISANGEKMLAADMGETRSPTGGFVYTYPTITSGGSNDNSSVPVAVDTTGVLSGKKVSRLTASNQSVYAITSDGAMYSWGENEAGQLGNNTTTDSNVPVAVDMTGVMSGKKARQVSAYDNYAFAIATDGTVYSWGDNKFGQLGNGTTANSSVPVAVAGALAGKNVTSIVSNGVSLPIFPGDGIVSVYALASDGTVYAWGDNSSDQLGDGTNNNSSSPVAVKSDGVLSGKFITSIAAAESTTAVGYALASDGSLYSWGVNYSGQLGNGTTTSSNVPVAVTQSSAIASIMINGQAATNITSPDGCTVSMTAPPNDPGTYDVVITYTDGTIVTIPQSLTYVEPSILLYLYGDNHIYADPFTNNGVGTTQLQTTVVTNDVTGYTVSVSSRTSDTNLVCAEAGRSSDVVPAMSGSSSNLVDDTWAYGLGSSVATPSTWNGMTATPTIFDSYSTDTAGRTHFLYFGAKVTMDTTPCDSYDGDIILTATTNWGNTP